MLRLKALASFDTSMGKTFIIEPVPIKVNDEVLIDGKSYKVKTIVFNSKPDKDNISITVW